MKIINGQFINSQGHVVPPKFGDPEQIVALKQAERLKTLYHGEGTNEYADHSITFNANAHLNWDCSCGRTLTIYSSGEDDHDEETAVEQAYKRIPTKSHTCKCGISYSVTHVGKEDMFNIKINP